MSGLGQAPDNGGAGTSPIAAEQAAVDLATLRSALAEKEADLSQATMLLNDMERRFVDLQTQLSSQQNSATEHNGTVETLRTTFQATGLFQQQSSCSCLCRKTSI